MVFQRGFEPPTPALGGRCSIQLSYWNKQAWPASCEASCYKHEIPQRSKDLQNAVGTFLTRPCASWSTRDTITEYRSEARTYQNAVDLGSYRRWIIYNQTIPRINYLKVYYKILYCAIKTCNKKSATSWLALTILENKLASSRLDFEINETSYSLLS